jgi:hypothetical protein
MCNHRNRGGDTTWGTYDSWRSVGSNWVCIRATITSLDLDYIKFAIKSIVTNYIKVSIEGSKPNHIKSIITTIITSDNRFVVTRA